MKKIIFFLTVLTCLFQNSTAQNQKLPELNIATKKILVDSIGNALNNYYVFPEKAIKMAEYVKKQCKNKSYDSLVNPNDFANKVLKDIRSIYNDKHLIIRYDPELEKRILIFNVTKKLDQVDFKKEEQQNFFFKKVEILPSNIGYIEFTNFSDTSQSARETVRAAMQFVSHSDALVLDLRNNYGGNGIMAGEIGSYFFKEKAFVGRSFNRVENKWTESWVENKQVITKGLVINMPIYILTSNRTFSAAEGLAYTLQQLKKAVIVGDTTRGGAHLTRSFSLGNGFVGFIPISRSENVITKTDWEDTGVVPDIKETETNSLTTAQKTILNKQLASLTDENEKRKINWLINYFNSKNTSLNFTKSEFLKFTGQFEEFEFSIQDSQLICTNSHQKNKTDRLIPISSTLFQIDNESQVEFVSNDKGICNIIKLHWNDGWVDTISRTY